MTDVEELAGAILDGLEVDRGVTEFKRTLPVGDGPAMTFRIDVTEVGEGHFVAAGVRQPAEGPRVELPPRRFARDDRAGLVSWLTGGSAEDPPRGRDPR